MIICLHSHQTYTISLQALRFSLWNSCILTFTTLRAPPCPPIPLKWPVRGSSPLIDLWATPRPAGTCKHCWCCAETALLYKTTKAMSHSVGIWQMNHDLVRKNTRLCPVLFLSHSLALQGWTGSKKRPVGSDCACLFSGFSFAIVFRLRLRIRPGGPVSRPIGKIHRL